MEKTFLQKFGPPKHWAVFQNVLDALHDDLRSDPVLLMERISPAFLRHADATKPFHFRVEPRGKHKSNFTDYTVVCKGMGRQGTYEYRVISVDKNRNLDVLDLRRVMDDQKLIGKKKNVKPITSTQDRFQRMLTRHLTGLYRRLPDSSSWVSDLWFLEDADTSGFQSMEFAREVTVKEMMKSLDGVVGDRFSDMKFRAYLQNLLTEALEKYDASQKPVTKQLLRDAASLLDREAIRLLTANPSSLTSSNYHWLTDQTRPKALPARRALVAACPILLLVGERTEMPSVSQAVSEDRFDVDQFIARTLYAHTPERLQFYKNMREHEIGLTNARILPRIAHYLAHAPNDVTLPKTPDEWAHIGGLVSTAHGIAPIIERDSLRVFADLVSTSSYEGEGSVARYFNMQSGGKPQSIADMAALRSRLALSVMAPKIMAEAQKRDLKMPLSDIFYIVAGKEFVKRGTVIGMNKKLVETIDAFNSQRNIMGHFFDGAPVDALLSAAFDFSTHRGSWDEKLREMIITSRLFEHAADYEWPHLPTIEMPESMYTVVPLKNQAELFQECYETGSDLWREGRRAVSEGVHFISIRNNGIKISATAMICEPRGVSGEWIIERIDRADGDIRNIHYRSVIEEYLMHPDFVRSVHSDKFDSLRARLRNTLISRAKDNELMGLRADSPRERAAVLNALRPYIKSAENWEIDQNGCFSAPKINAITNTLLTNIAPFYRNRAPA